MMKHTGLVTILRRSPECLERDNLLGRDHCCLGQLRFLSVLDVCTKPGANVRHERVRPSKPVWLPGLFSGNWRCSWTDAGDIFAADGAAKVGRRR